MIAVGAIANQVNLMMKMDNAINRKIVKKIKKKGGQ
jgi:hypothetical protein